MRLFNDIGIPNEMGNDLDDEISKLIDQFIKKCVNENIDTIDLEILLTDHIRYKICVERVFKRNEN